MEEYIISTENLVEEYLFDERVALALRGLI